MPLFIALADRGTALAELIAQKRERSFRTYGYQWLWLKNRRFSATPKLYCEL